MYCHSCENEDENITLIWDDELDKPVCESCYNNTANEGYKMLYQLEFLRQLTENHQTL